MRSELAFSDREKSGLTAVAPSWPFNTTTCVRRPELFQSCQSPCYRRRMRRIRPKWRAGRGARALKTVNEIEASIAALPAEDLLDLHDIFRELANSPLNRLALVEMRRRQL